MFRIEYFAAVLLFIIAASLLFCYKRYSMAAKDYIILLSFNSLYYTSAAVSAILEEGGVSGHFSMESLTFLLSIVVLDIYNIYIFDLLKLEGVFYKRLRFVPLILSVVFLILFFIYPQEMIGKKGYREIFTDPLILTVTLPGTMITLIDLYVLFKNHKKLGMINSIPLAVYPLFSVRYILPERLFDYFGPTYGGQAVVLILIFLLIQNVRMLEQMVLENEMANRRLDMIEYHVKPHFIFNVLNTIYYLCDSDVKMAQENISHLSNYIRDNLTGIGEEDLVEFSTEVSTIKNYLALEKMRYGEELEYYFDLKESDFLIPRLSVEMFVESAVKTGVRGKADGGSVTVSTYREKDEIHILVKDDGNGYVDGRQVLTDSPYVGLLNAKERVGKMCNGTVNITSKRGRGTTVEIVLPADQSELQGRRG